jgi:hypothetical protein
MVAWMSPAIPARRFWERALARAFCEVFFDSTATEALFHSLKGRGQVGWMKSVQETERFPHPLAPFSVTTNFPNAAIEH